MLAKAIINICLITTNLGEMVKDISNPFQYYTDMGTGGCSQQGAHGRGVATCSSTSAAVNEREFLIRSQLDAQDARLPRPQALKSQNYSPPGPRFGTTQMGTASIIGTLQPSRSRGPDIGQLVTSRDNHETSTLGAAMVPNAVYPNTPHIIPMRTQAN